MGIGKVFDLFIYLFISNEDVNDLIKVKKSFEDLDVLFDTVSETVKHEI